MTDSKTATERLREMLDERGVEYEVDERNAITKWSTHYGAFVFFARQREGKLLVETTVATEHSVILTPEQAIAATLGVDASAARLAERLRGIADEMRNTGASTMTPHELLAFYAREIGKVADSLVFAATLGSGECEQVLTDCDDGLMPPFTAHCSKCGAEWGFTPKFCHNCGSKVVATCDERKAVKR